MYYCDIDGSETIDRYEFFECSLAAENAWRRDTNCYPLVLLECYNPYIPITCNGAYSCSEIDYYSDEVFSALDTDGNAFITSFDDIDAGKLAVLTDLCD
jgi:hypothetical protein